MSNNQFIERLPGTFLCAIIVLFFVAYVPYKIATSEHYGFITEIGQIRLLGPFLILIGIFGYLACFSNFIKDAKGSPIMGDSQRLIVKGLYKHVRNPIYISMYVVLMGEALFYQSLGIVYYLLAWVLVLYVVVIFIEEPFLRVKFEDQYDQYCKLVPRWIPRIHYHRKIK